MIGRIGSLLHLLDESSGLSPLAAEPVYGG
jgi:hypothetical protein